MSPSMKHIDIHSGHCDFSLYPFLVIEPAPGGDHEENTQDGRGREGTSAVSL